MLIIVIKLNAKAQMVDLSARLVWNFTDGFLALIISGEEYSEKCFGSLWFSMSLRSSEREGDKRRHVIPLRDVHRSEVTFGQKPQ